MLVGVSVGVDVGVLVEVGVLVGVPVGVAVAVCVGVLVGVPVAVAVFVGVPVGVRVGVPVDVAVLLGVAVGALVSVNVQVTVSPLCNTMLLGVCVDPWLLVQVAVVKDQSLGSGVFSVTEYGVEPVCNPLGKLFLESNVPPPVRLNCVETLPGPPLRVKLNWVVVSLDGLVTLLTMISPGTGTEIPGKVWHWHFEGAPGSA